MPLEKSTMRERVKRRATMPGKKALSAQVRPSLPAPTIWVAASGMIENTVQSTMIPARSDMELFPKPVTKAFRAVSSRERMYTA